MEVWTGHKCWGSIGSRKMSSEKFPVDWCPCDLKNGRIQYSVVGIIFCFEQQSRPRVYSQSLNKGLLIALMMLCLKNLERVTVPWKMVKCYNFTLPIYLTMVGSGGKATRGNQIYSDA